MACLKFLENMKHDQNYNLLLLNNFIFIVLRSKSQIYENDTTIPVNALGYAGTLAVKKEEDLKIVKKYGPIGILE